MKWYKLFDSEAEAAQQIPLAKARQVTAEGRKICVARTREGLFAVDDTCPHLGESLSKGTTNYLNEVVCPWHSYRYSLRTGAECQHRTRQVAVHKVEVREDGVYLGIAD